MKRNSMFIALLAGVFAFGMAACGDDDGGTGDCGNGVCGAGETYDNCPADCDPPLCNADGVCDAGENCAMCPDDDCCTDCENPTGAVNDYIVHQLFLPDTSQAAGANGVDLDGDGDIDNKLGQIIQLLVSNGLEGDINESINDEIASGGLMLLGRMTESGMNDDIVSVQIFQGEFYDATPIFDGNDSVLIADGADMDLHMCGIWSDPELETDPSNITLAFPLPEIGMLSVTLSRAQVRTVDDPDSDFYGNSSVTPTEWNNVMIGGGLSQDEIYNNLIPFLTTFISDMVAEGGSTADTIADLFDGNCVVLDDVPGCEAVVAGEGECDDQADPPVITVTELKCNALLNSALSPDVDSDGDGEDDLLSLGLRVTHAVSVNIVTQ
ncbi:MAG: hypothetical protein ABI333_00180 [bacterium]